MPARGGSARLVIGAVREGYWAVCGAGILFIDPNHTDSVRKRLLLWEAGTGNQRVLAELPYEAAYQHGGLTASTDAREVIYTVTRKPADIMMLDLR